MKSDIEIAQSIKMKNIIDVAKDIGLNEDDLEFYGKYKAKVSFDVLKKNKKDTRLILVTAINPTPAGEGKTTTTVGLADAFQKINIKSVVALREPSLGPVFGVKGGAAGGGYAQVVPMEDINLHFTGDFHAIGAANNLIAAMLDNHIFQGNELDIDIENITWRRCVDMNDRQLRNVIDGLGGPKSGVERKDGYDITVASEIMAVFCLANDIEDLKNRLGKIVIAYDKKGSPVTVDDIKATGAATALLKDALKPNLVQTLEHTPAFVHGGPFANIAHGCNSVIATKCAMNLGDVVVTEAGFGADLGAEKFFDIKCRKAGLRPDACVIVATIRALKSHGGVLKEDLNKENIDALKKGLPNLLQHIDNIKNVYKLPLVVAINKFPFDTEKEIEEVRKACKKYNANVALSEVWEKGGEGGIELAKEVLKLFDEKNNFSFSYDEKDTITKKIEDISKKIYHADNVIFTDEAKIDIKNLEKNGYDKMPICMAKTQYSFSDDAKLLGAPKGFDITVKKLKVSNGAGFIVALTGSILTMPGLPKTPAAENINVDKNGKISGLF